MFAYKDQRFVCLSRAAAVVLFILPWVDLFLQKRLNITNRLACIDRGFLNIEYLIPVFTVFAAVGIQLIEPFYCKTISTEATLTLLKEFYQNLHDTMSNPVTFEFFDFKSPWFPCVSQGLLKGVCESYTAEVVSCVPENAVKYKEP